MNMYGDCTKDSVDDQSTLLQCIAKNTANTHDDIVRTMNMFFLIYASSLVFFMQTGFAMICAGCVRKKNLINSMLKNLLDACGAALAYFSVGYGLSYGGDSKGNTLIGNGNFFLSELNSNEYSNWLFQFSFAATSATIVAGTIAERCQMKSYLLYSMFLTGFVYPVIAHCVWSKNGFLSIHSEEPLWGVGMIDFAGSTVVHISGGLTALVAAKILGPRKGRFYQESGEKLEEPKTMNGHSTSLQMLGTLILWFCWFGFNAGNAIHDVNAVELRPTLMAISVINTTLCASTAGITALFANLILTERKTGEAIYNIQYAMNGCISGLVAITGACAVVEPWVSIIIGFVAGLNYLFTSKLLVRLCVDDAVDAIPIHLSNGVWGTLAVGLFATRVGIERLPTTSTLTHIGWFYSWGEGSNDATLLGFQAFGILVISCWVLSLMLPFFFALNYFGMLRSDALEEMVGLDVTCNSSLSDVYSNSCFTEGTDNLGPDYEEEKEGYT